jgi:hypothetical protein
VTELILFEPLPECRPLFRRFSEVAVLAIDVLDADSIVRGPDFSHLSSRIRERVHDVKDIRQRFAIGNQQKRAAARNIGNPTLKHLTVTDLSARRAADRVSFLSSHERKLKREDLMKRYFDESQSIYSDKRDNWIQSAMQWSSSPRRERQCTRCVMTEWELENGAA